MTTADDCSLPLGMAFEADATLVVESGTSSFWTSPLVLELSSTTKGESEESKAETSNPKFTGVFCFDEPKHNFRGGPKCGSLYNTATLTLKSPTASSLKLIQDLVACGASVTIGSDTHACGAPIIIGLPFIVALNGGLPLDGVLSLRPDLFAAGTNGLYLPRGSYGLPVCLSCPSASLLHHYGVPAFTSLVTTPFSASLALSNPVSVTNVQMVSPYADPSAFSPAFSTKTSMGCPGFLFRNKFEEPRETASGGVRFTSLCSKLKLPYTTKLYAVWFNIVSTRKTETDTSSTSDGAAPRFPLHKVTLTTKASDADSIVHEIPASDLVQIPDVPGYFAIVGYQSTKSDGLAALVASFSPDAPSIDINGSVELSVDAFESLVSEPYHWLTITQFVVDNKLRFPNAYKNML